MTDFFIISDDGLVAAQIGPFKSISDAEDHLQKCCDISPVYGDMTNVIIPACRCGEFDTFTHLTPAEDLHDAAVTELMLS